MIGLYSKPRGSLNSQMLRGAALSVLIALGGCSSGSLSSQSDTPPEESAPTSLTPRTAGQADGGGGGGGGAVVAKLEEPELRKAVERYRMAKRRGEGPYDFVGVDLTGDGRPEAVVLFGGPDWCQKTGCSLVVFQREQVGYKAVSHVTAARGPVLVGREANFGWRDLIVKSGADGAAMHTVRLVFSGKGYPANAALQPEAPRDMVAQAQQILVETSITAPAADDATSAPAPAGTN